MMSWITRWTTRLVFALVGLLVLVGAGVAGTAIALYLAIVSDLPDLKGIDDYRPSLASTVYDRDGQPIGEFFDERRRLVHLDEIPEHVILAFVAGEDDNFFEHSGIDFRAILRAAWADFTAGEIVQGGSTITQQTVKSLLLTPEQRFDRKIKEMILARRLEQQLSKDEILTLYLNQIYFGGGAWGIGEAARTYFGKPIGELTVSEGAMLAGLPKAPSRFSPLGNFEAAEVRRQYVLGRMFAVGFIDQATYDDARATRRSLRGPPEREDFVAATWFVEEVRRHLYEKLGGDTVLKGGLRIETTLDLHLQRAAETGAAPRTRGGRPPPGLARAGAPRSARPDRGGSRARRDREQARPQRRPDARIPRSREDVARRRDGERRRQAPRSCRIRAESGLRAPSTATPPGRARAASRRCGAGGKRTPGAFRRRRRALPRAAAGSRGRSAERRARFRVGRPAGQNRRDRSRLRPPRRASPSTRRPRWRVRSSLWISRPARSSRWSAATTTHDRQFDRAVQARRQPGSAFKPFVYATAMTKGLTATTALNDSPFYLHRSGERRVVVAARTTTTGPAA